MTVTSTRSAKNPVELTRERIRDVYGGAIGRRVEELPTPAMVVDLAAAQRNIARMASSLAGLPATIRPHLKTHKSPDLAAMQVAAGAVGLSLATVWEAVAMAWAGFDDLFVVNTVSHPEKVRVLAELARGHRVLVAVDDAANAADLSAAAVAAGAEIGILIEVDTGMDRAGVDSAGDALILAEQAAALSNLRFEGLTGYEGHCSLEPDEGARSAKQRVAMDLFLEVADRLESAGFPCRIRSAGGTATWNLTASRKGITEIQAGTYVLMDNFHGRMVGGFEPAMTIATTVISMPPGRLIVDVGSKSVGVGGGPTLRDPVLPVVRFDEEHGIFVADHEPGVRVGSVLHLVPGYSPGTVNMYDNFFVIADGQVVDVWPVFPRGPGHNGLLTPPS